MREEDGYTLSSPLFEALWSRPEMRAQFSDRELVASWTRVETELARAQAACGLIPEEAAAAICTTGDTITFDLVAMREGIQETFHVLMPFLNQFRNACPGEAGQYLHWGATTQDIIDTSLMLRAKATTAVILAELEAVEAVLAGICRSEASTVMAGRTHGQQALPITFGFKAAGWLGELRRDRERLTAMATRCFVVSIGGAVGTFAYMGEKGTEVARKVAQSLGLGWDPISWQSARDRVGEMLSTFILTGSSIGRIGQELAQLQKTEIAEVHEPHGPGQIGSSTMPQKRNPSMAEGLVTMGLMLRGQAGLAMELMSTEHERDDSRWQIEARLVPEVFLLLDGQVGTLRALLEGLEVDRERMRANITAEMCGEPLMKALAQHIGRHRAHDVLHECFMHAHERRIPILEVLLASEPVTSHLDEASLRSLIDPASYIGLSKKIATDAADAST